ncbi:MAG: pirin family protein [bacterium]
MSITITKKDEFGRADYGWLQACYHFSFADYYNPDRKGFGVLRVVNDDCIHPGKGFDLHPHRNMEIITYVKEGAITHHDSQGNKGRTEAGNIQVMSAGSGIYHSEFNHETVNTTLYQIWIEPHTQHVTPSWNSLDVKSLIPTEGMQCLISGDGTSPLHIYQDVHIYVAKFETNTRVTHPLNYLGYILIVKGSVKIDGQNATTGDSIMLENESTIDMVMNSQTEVIILDIPPKSVPC